MRIEKMFSALKERGVGAFMPYVCCGDPSAEFTLALIEKLVGNGADAIELGIPFSDPIADGKTIQAASSRALDSGMTPLKALGIVSEVRKRGIEVPILIMAYYNIVYANGGREFLKKVKEAGADGMIVPDAPLEESSELRKLCSDAGIDLIYFITPNCPDSRLKEIASVAKGFLYAVAVLGITGEREVVAPEAIALVERARKVTALPVVVGFGISKPSHATSLMRAGGSGIIVGSAIVNLYSKHVGEEFDSTEALEEIGEFAKSMKGALSGK
ncbi:tryptophan synthase subunit alpha [Candidatus Micrarchaeota archaeon]|nr:tryptophan synthase subunit alpha [Candidatus Micrarchaeota archaeon]